MSVLLVNPSDVDRTQGPPLDPDIHARIHPLSFLSMAIPSLLWMLAKIGSLLAPVVPHV